jgi:hypothetical protein
MIIECSNCRQYVEAKEVGSYWRHFEGREPSRRYTLLACTTCQEPILVGQTNIGNMAEGDKWDTPFVVFPQGEIRVNPSAPVEIRSAFQKHAPVIARKHTQHPQSCAVRHWKHCAAHGVEKRNLSASLGR